MNIRASVTDAARLGYSDESNSIEERNIRSPASMAPACKETESYPYLKGNQQFGVIVMSMADLCLAGDDKAMPY